RSTHPTECPASARQHAGNDLTTVPPVNAEIGVRSQQNGIVQRLGHAHKTGIRETDRNVRIFLQELEQRFPVIRETVPADEGASAEQCGEASGSALAK